MLEVEQRPKRRGRRALMEIGFVPHNKANVLEINIAVCIMPNDVVVVAIVVHHRSGADKNKDAVGF